jgi:hypothetical protein
MDSRYILILTSRIYFFAIDIPISKAQSVVPPSRYNHTEKEVNPFVNPFQKMELVGIEPAPL